MASFDTALTSTDGTDPQLMDLCDSESVASDTTETDSILSDSTDTGCPASLPVTTSAKAVSVSITGKKRPRAACFSDSVRPQGIRKAHRTLWWHLLGYVAIKPIQHRVGACWGSVLPQGIRKAHRTLWWHLNKSVRVSSLCLPEDSGSVAASNAVTLLGNKCAPGSRNTRPGEAFWQGIHGSVTMTIDCKQHSPFCPDNVRCHRSEAIGDIGDRHDMWMACHLSRCWDPRPKLRSMDVAATSELEESTATGAMFCHGCYADPGVWLQTNWKLAGDLTSVMPRELWDLVKTFVPDAPFYLGRLFELKSAKGRFSTNKYHHVAVGPGGLSVISTGRKREPLPFRAVFA